MEKTLAQLRDEWREMERRHEADRKRDWEMVRFALLFLAVAAILTVCVGIPVVSLFIK